MDQTDVGLKSVVKALSDTVAGAIDPDDHLAKEQLRLAIGYLEFVRQRLHLIHARERFDLKHYADLAEGLLKLDLTARTEAGQLRRRLGEARPMLGDPAVLTADVRSVSTELAHAVAALIKAEHDAGSKAAAAVDRLVLDATDERLAMERKWYEPIGFEPAPLGAPTLEERLK